MRDLGSFEDLLPALGPAPTANTGLVTEQQRSVLTAGLAWLYDTTQPDGAGITHHGVTSPKVDGRRYQFIPQGAHNRPVVVVDVAEPKYPNDPNLPILNPLGGQAEMDAYTVVLRELGAEVATTWNGKGETGSLGLALPAHPSLVAAVRLYLDGCPVQEIGHRGSSLCSCGWFDHPKSLLIKPTWPAVGGES